MNTSPDNIGSQLISDRFGELFEALEVLYIKGNLSGRIKFAEGWPDIAALLFGDELLHSDREGTKDRARRAVLEQEAEDRRLSFLEMLEGVEGNSVREGILQIEYVQGLVQQVGRRLALFIYTHAIVDRFIPPSPEEVAAAVKAAPVMAAAKAHEPEEEIIMHVPEDPMDRIKPISVEEDMSPPPLPEPEIVPERDLGLRPDQLQAVQAQQDILDDEPEGKPLFVAGQIPEAAPMTEPEVIPEAAPEAAPPPRKKLSIFRISDAAPDKKSE